MFLKVLSVTGPVSSEGVQQLLFNHRYVSAFVSCMNKGQESDSKSHFTKISPKASENDRSFY